MALALGETPSIDRKVCPAYRNEAACEAPFDLAVGIGAPTHPMHPELPDVVRESVVGPTRKRAPITLSDDYGPALVRSRSTAREPANPCEGSAR